MPMIPLPFGEYTVKAVFAFPFSPGTALPFLPVGDIALDFSHPGVIAVRELRQMLHYNLLHVTGPGWLLRTNRERVNLARPQAFHGLFLIVETRCFSCCPIKSILQDVPFPGGAPLAIQILFPTSCAPLAFPSSLSHLRQPRPCQT